MLSLTINTSSSLGSMVIGRDDRVVGQVEWHKEKSHSEKVTLALEDLAKQTSCSLHDLQLLICGYGPGSFTGLRVGLSVAKTLAYSFNLPIIAVDDCMALALNVLESANRQSIAVLIDAQKNKVFAATYEVGIDQTGQPKLSTILPPSLLDMVELDQRLTLPSYVCVGDGYKAYEGFFPEKLKQKLVRPAITDDEPHAQKVFSYVIRNSETFQKITWSQLSALYLRASAAEEVLADKMSKNK